MNRPIAREIVPFIAAAACGVAIGVMLSSRAGSRERAIRSANASGPRAAKSPATVLAARRLNRAAGTLAASVLADSSVEHYRGSFKNKAMFAPLAVSTLTLAISIHGTSDARPLAHKVRDVTYLLAAATGVAGSGFHLYNVGKRTGGFSWQNLFYGAPLGAPMAILLSGLLGFCSERVRESRPGSRPEILRLPAGRTIAAVTGAGLLGTTGEAGLLHFRGAYHNPFMAVPVSLPPVGAIFLLRAAAAGPGRAHPVLRWWMRLLAAMGLAGAGFHTYGVSRNMGGWRNWRQNVLNGPPIPAPPSFSGLALAGLAALGLMKEHPDA